MGTITYALRIYRYLSNISSEQMTIPIFVVVFTNLKGRFSNLFGFLSIDAYYEISAFTMSHQDTIGPNISSERLRSAGRSFTKVIEECGRILARRLPWG